MTSVTEERATDPVRDRRRPRIFFGWTIVFVAFAIATFGWGVGFYGPGIYLVALNTRHGWPISLISFAITMYYLLGASVVAFVGDIFERFGPRRMVLCAVGAMGIGLLALTQLWRPWQLYIAFAVMAVGWAGMSVAAINAILAPWFEKKRGLAVSMALNGASFGGVLMVPLWTILIAAVGFPSAALIVVGGMMAILVPLVALYLHRGPEVVGLGADGAPAHRDREPGTLAPGQLATMLGRAELIRSSQFWTISLPFSLGLLAQVGFLTHQVAYLSPLLGAEGAALAVSLTTLAAIAGRVLTGFVIDRVDRRAASACNFIVQAVAVSAMIGWPSTLLLYAACVLFGFGVGNMITLPALIVQVEYPKEHFNRVVGLNAAICHFTFAFGPGILGWVRDRWETYSAALVVCAACEVLAAAVVMIRSSALHPHHAGIQQ